MSKSVNVDFVTRQIEVETDGKEHFISAAIAAKDAEQSMLSAQNAANTAEKIATDLGLVDEAVQTAVSSAEQASNGATAASNKADVATAKADIATTKASEASASADTATQKAEAASASATNAAQSYANTDAIATQLTEYLATKESLTAPAVDKTLLIEGAAADSKVVGTLEDEIKSIVKDNAVFNQRFIVVEGDSTYVYKNIDISDGIVVGGKYRLSIDSVEGATASDLAYLYMLDKDDNVISSSYLLESTMADGVVLTATAATKKIRVQLYPASGISMENGKALYKNVLLVCDEYLQKAIRNDIAYDRLENIEYLFHSSKKNKFNYNATNRLHGAYVNAEGQVIGSDAYISVFVNIEGGKPLICNNDFIYVTFYDKINYLASRKPGDALNGFINGYVLMDNVPVVTPVNSKYMCVSFQADRDRLQIEYGTEKTSFEPYREGLSKSIILDEMNILYVGKGYKYSSIQDAVNDANDGDTIMVMEGVYNEHVSVYGDTGWIHTSTKNLRIIGYNRDKCIITYDVGDYSKPPLEIAKGVVENITFRCTGTEYAEGSSQYAYCCHIDNNFEANSALQFKNCNFKNTVYPCVGVGLRDGFYLTFTQCVFDCDQSAAFLFHEEQDSNKVNQNIAFDDCTFISGNEYETIHVQQTTENTGNNVNVTFRRCIVKNTNGGELARAYDANTGDRPQGNKWLNTDIFTLTDMSALNSDNLFNS